jgi:hypothetical protein
MIPNLARYMNRTIFVSIPVLFEDTACRPVRLLGAELNGLWLQSDELTERLAPAQPFYATTPSAVVFIPFAQMAGVLIHLSAPAQDTETPAHGDSSDARVTAESKRQGAGRSKGNKSAGASEQG